MHAAVLVEPGRLVVDINVGCGICYYCRRNEILNCVKAQQIGISCDGAGPIGNLNVQRARLVGAAPIIVAETSPERAEMACEAGADIAVTNPGLLSETVRKNTAGRGADVVIESVGHPDLYQEAFRLIRPGGHVTTFGITDPGDSVPLDLLQTVLRENSIKVRLPEWDRICTMR